MELGRHGLKVIHTSALSTATGFTYFRIHKTYKYSSAIPISSVQFYQDLTPSYLPTTNDLLTGDGNLAWPIKSGSTYFKTSIHCGLSGTRQTDMPRRHLRRWTARVKSIGFIKDYAEVSLPRVNSARRFQVVKPVSCPSLQTIRIA